MTLLSNEAFTNGRRQSEARLAVWQSRTHAIYPPPNKFRKPPASVLSGGADGMTGMGETNTSAERVRWWRLCLEFRPRYSHLTMMLPMLLVTE